MKTSHIAIASLGTVCFHAMIVCALFFGNVHIPEPLLHEFIVTNVMLLDEPKPLLNPDIMPLKPEPIADVKPQKSMKKVVTKSEPIKESFKEVATTQASTKEVIQEPTSQAVSTAKTEESSPATNVRQNEDLLFVYLAKVRHKIQNNLHYSSMAKKMGLEGESIVQFLIHTNGIVETSSIKVAKSSGKAILDRNAIEAIIEASPFEQPPKEDLQIVIPVVFKLKS